MNKKEYEFIKIKKVSGSIGAVIENVQLNNDLNEEVFDEIYDAFLKLLICLELKDVCSKATFRLIKVVVATEFYGTLLKKSALIFQMMKRINFFTKMH